MREVTNFDPPEDLLAQFRAWEEKPYRPNSGNLATAELGGTLEPNPIVVPYGEGAKEKFDEMESELRGARKELRKEGYAGLFTRVRENAIKIALILAGGQNPEAPEITEADAHYACALALTIQNNLLNDVRREVSSNRVEAHHKAVLRLIKDAGPNGIGLKELGQKCKNFGLDKRPRDELLKELESWGSIVSTVEQSQGKRNITVFRFLKE